MSQFRYILEPYSGMKSRHSCPNCLKKGVFTFYIDKETGKRLPARYGKCERLINCGYHLNPYKDGYLLPHGLHTQKVYQTQSAPLISTKRIMPFPKEIFEESLRCYEENKFVAFLNDSINKVITKRLIQRFHIGTSKHWEGATVFWVIDEKNQVLGGQVVLFDERGHTRKEKMPDGRTKRYTSWVHTALKKSYQRNQQPFPNWLIEYDSHALKFPCLFGLHQLKDAPRSKPIAIVEAPKTAIIASGYFPQFIWLAAGGMSYLNEARLRVLEGRNIVLFPDRGGYERWKKVAEKLEELANFQVSDLLEQRKAMQGADLADYLGL